MVSAGSPRPTGRGSTTTCDPRVWHREPGQLGGDVVGEAFGGGLAGPRHVGRERRHFVGEAGPLPVELLEQLVRGVQLGQPRPGVVGPGDHAVDVLGVFAGQRPQRGPALVDLLEPVRIGLQTREVGTDLGGDVGDE